MKYAIPIILSLLLSACQTTIDNSVDTRPSVNDTATDSNYRRAQSSNKIDYDRDVQFKLKPGMFMVSEQAEYGRRYNHHYSIRSNGTRMFPSRYDRRSQNCESELSVSDLNLRSHVNTADPDQKSSTVKECLNFLQVQMASDYASNRRNSAAMNFFFDVITPNILAGAWSRENDPNGSTTEKMVEKYFALYSLYADWRGTSDDLDRQVLNEFFKRERTVVDSLTRKRYLNCPADSFAIYPHLGNYNKNACANYGAERALTRVLMGLKFQHKDTLREGIAILEHIASSSHGDGATLDAYRGGDAVGYLMQLSTSLDPAAFMVTQYTNINAYELGGGKFDNTVYDVLDYSFKSMMDPESNYKYSSKNVFAHNGNYKTQIWKQNQSANDVRQKQGNWVQASAGYTHNKPSLATFYNLNNRNRYQVTPGWSFWNGKILADTVGFKLK
jgi:hypothetical protein